MAVAIWLLGIRYIFEKEFGKYAVCTLIAMGFHTSACFMLPLYFIPNLKGRGTKIILPILSIVFPVIIVLLPIITRIFGGYAYGTYLIDDAGAIYDIKTQLMRPILLLSIFLAFGYLHKRIRSEKEYTFSIVQLYIYFLFVIAASTFVICGRMIYYVIPFVLVYISSIVGTCNRELNTVVWKGILYIASYAYASLTIFNTHYSFFE